MSEHISQTSSREEGRRPLGVVKTMILGLAGLFYAYGVWNAVAYLVTVAQFGLNGYGWFVLLFSVLFPVLVFTAAFALGRRRGALEFAVVLAAGLALVAVFWMNVVAMSVSNMSSLTS
ncbi:hypothetical protein HD600_002473 [Microbacterium ginsengiterrae]|uniref:Uncharacterized protein n=1 Tax=Microbacterium ginsengiterrae TaxID=546115 RepID=A0A7W9CEC2_9MICO|nr:MULTISPECIES: hypothetical protein [Microbacterium]MBB5743976.1 hypothetical protein [Microbacterium ginsengiterrae]